MPIPEFVAVSNRYLLNPVTRLFAGKIAPFALLIHHGRTSGRDYTTPIMAFPTGDGFVIALTYGRDTDWQRNVEAEGGCDLVYRRCHHELTNPRLILEAQANPHLPWLVRQLLPRLNVHDFLRLDDAE